MKHIAQSNSLHLLVCLHLASYYSEGIVGGVVIDLDSAEALRSSTCWQPLLIAIIVDHHSGPSLADTRLTTTKSKIQFMGEFVWKYQPKEEESALVDPEINKHTQQSTKLRSDRAMLRPSKYLLHWLLKGRNFGYLDFISFTVLRNVYCIWPVNVHYASLTLFCFLFFFFNLTTLQIRVSDFS